MQTIPPLSVQKGLVALIPKIKNICSVAGAPGLALCVDSQGEPFHESNFGLADVDGGEEVTCNTIFPIGALAKSLTASAVGLLVDSGKLEWTTLVKDVLPGFRSRSDVVTNHLTVVDLLSHRAGLAKFNFWWQGAEGVQLIDKSELLRYYQELEPTGSFRADWAYSNWGYAVVGEVIAAVSGMTYAEYLERKILRPLRMKNTSFRPVDPSSPGVAKPYVAMDDASPRRVAFPAVNSESLMCPAMGGTSTARDLANYATALLKAYRYETNRHGSQPVLRHALTQLTGHMFTDRSMMEKSYALGFYRSQLPSTISGMGANATYVGQLPVVIPGDASAGPVLAHGGSLAGYSTAMVLLPEMNTSIVVCTNSLGLGYASGWVALAVLETIVETPTPSDYVLLASEAAAASAGDVRRLQAFLERDRPQPPEPPRPLEKYVGRYTHTVFRDWFLDIRKRPLSHRLEVVFMGLGSQAWLMEHYSRDTFLWLADREEQVTRGRMPTYLVADHFKLVFQPNDKGEVDGLCWAHEARIPLKEQRFVKKV
ncbi:hypothetical protein E4U42_002266 [Claviceps africana]|uniref:Beta-lactamase-related domain-containing protein n=1 Tax=Claviceps africana TaxID=83212 RepID=A0A8K0J9Q8_9HYPO|nr:hypothetical protein E4U42_002266 [Claviceps africana]